MSEDSGFQVPPELQLRGPLGDWFDRMMPDALAYFERLADEAQQVAPHESVIPMDGPADLTVRKLSATTLVPDELLMDMGMLPDTRVRKPPPWRWRVRNRVSGWREKLACRAYKLITGYEVPDREDW